jgi:hypothetical protein
VTRPRSVVALLAGCALIVIVNAVILGEAVWNRGGERLAELTLTERELAVPQFRENESSGLVLTLKFASQPPTAVQRVAWRKRNELPAVDYPWLDRGKLEALGFRLGPEPSAPPDEHGGVDARERTAFVALELDGDSWTGWLAAREDRVRKHLSDADAAAVLALDREMRSRLVPVDAGNDAEALRRRHPDRARYLIVPGLVRAVRAGPDSGGASWRGQIAEVFVGDIRVPRELAPALKKFLPRETSGEAFEREQREREVSWPAPTPPRYRAVVVFGRRNDPWLVSVSELAGN